MNFNFSNEQAPVPRPAVFGHPMYKPLEWSHNTPTQMPWSSSPNQQQHLMTFGSQNFCSMPPKDDPSKGINFRWKNPSNSIHCKRKSDLGRNEPAKQHITEEKMAAHMSRLHISSESPQESAIGIATSGEPDTAREKRLVMCEEMRKLQTESVIPAALMRRLERPCMAVMLWQPPERSRGILSVSSSTIGSCSSSESNSNNNNNMHADLNISANPTNTDSEVTMEEMELDL